MSNAVQIKSSGPDTQALEAVLMRGDISKLTPDQKAQYVGKLCEIMGLSVLTQPFQFMNLQGKEVCYAGKNCAEQLRKVHNVSLRVTAREKIDDVYVVTVDAQLPNGRVDSATGAVPLTGLRGDALANAMMKAETKAKRRATLSICSLGMLDETEVETIKPAGRDDLRENGNTDPRPGILQFGYFTQKSCAEVERNEGRDALEREHERLSNHKDPRGQQAYHMIDEYLRMFAPGEALEAEEAPEEPQAKAHPVCVCGSAFVKSKTKPTYYCPNFKAQGEHSRNVPADQVEG